MKNDLEAEVRAMRDEVEADGDEAKVRYFRPAPPEGASQVYSIRIPVERIEELRQLAIGRGVAPTVLVRRWVLERLDAESTVRPVLRTTIQVLRYQEKPSKERVRGAATGTGRSRTTGKAASSDPLAILLAC
jgi:hypothetical protein